jgi:hypothetical protein
MAGAKRMKRLPIGGRLDTENRANGANPKRTHSDSGKAIGSPGLFLILPFLLALHRPIILETAVGQTHERQFHSEAGRVRDGPAS